MNREIGRVNRIGLGLTGLVLILAGAAGLAGGLGAYGVEWAVRTGPPSADAFARFLAGGWAYRLALIGPAVALAIAGMGWLLVQLHTMIARARPPRTDDTRHTRAAMAELAAAAERCPSVRRASCQLVGTEARPWLALTVGCADDANLPALRERLRDDDLPRAREALAMPGLPMVIRFRVLRAATGRSD
jgi:hypothetical protein